MRRGIANWRMIHKMILWQSKNERTIFTDQRKRQFLLSHCVDDEASVFIATAATFLINRLLVCDLRLAALYRLVADESCPGPKTL
jgi:hypothetical protein